jgi:hypothetical protein
MMNTTAVPVLVLSGRFARWPAAFIHCRPDGRSSSGGTPYQKRYLPLLMRLFNEVSGLRGLCRGPADASSRVLGRPTSPSYGKAHGGHAKVWRGLRDPETTGNFIRQKPRLSVSAKLRYALRDK